MLGGDARGDVGLVARRLVVAGEVRDQRQRGIEVDVTERLGPVAWPDAEYCSCEQAPYRTHPIMRTPSGQSAAARRQSRMDERLRLLLRLINDL